MHHDYVVLHINAALSDIRIRTYLFLIKADFFLYSHHNCVNTWKHTKRKCRYDVVQRTAVSVINVMDFRFFFFFKVPFGFMNTFPVMGSLTLWETRMSTVNFIKLDLQFSQIKFGEKIKKIKKMTRHKYCAKASSQISWLIKGEIYWMHWNVQM